MQAAIDQILAQRARLEEAELRRMLEFWDPALGEPTVIYDRGGMMLGIGPKCEIGEFAVITVHAMKIVFRPGSPAP